ncbi:MAG: spondin domain-containing protein [Acidimicrobiales bacterium]
MTTSTSPTRKLAKLSALLLALSLGAAACGANGSADALSSAAETDDTAEGDTDDEGSADDDESAATGDTTSVTVTIENIADFAITDSGVFDTPVGAVEPGPALPGDAYEFSFHASPGQRLSFATMFVQTNDWFFAPNPDGVELFDGDGTPISGDITDQVLTFDAGTEIDQPVGTGADQAPRQSGPDTGDADPDTSVREVPSAVASEYVAVVITPGDDGRFDVRIENASGMQMAPSPIAPGVYAVHSPEVALFELGAPDAGHGLEALAEDGTAGPFAEYLSGLTGTPTPIAPGAWAVHGPDVALYELGAPDAGAGHEGVAEDGDPAALAETLAGLAGVDASGVFNTPDGATEPGPVLPGDSYTFEVPLVDGRLSFSTMFVQSNDWVFATPAEGLDLDDLEGDITDRLLVVDIGTEVDQVPGFGLDQAPRQAGPDTGDADPEPNARIVEERSAARYITVTVSR